MLHRLRPLVSRLASVALLALVALASLPATAAAQSSTILIRAARMLDVESGRMIAPAQVLIEGGRIAALSPETVPEGAEILDLGDLTLLPGLIDAHTHLTLQLRPNMQLNSVTESDAHRAIQGVGYAEKTLLAGFTTVRDLGSRGFVDIALAQASDQGLIAAPRILPAGHGLSITGGHGDATGFNPGLLEFDYRAGVADGADEVLRATRYQIKHGARVIKLVATAGVLSFEESVGAQQYTAEEIETAVREAARHGLAVAAHAHGSEGILAAVEAGVASIEHGSLLTDEIMARMKEKGTYLVPTTYLVEAIALDLLPPPIRAKAEWVLPRAVESLKKAIRAGVPIAFGTDAGVFPHGDNAKELTVLVEKRGMQPLAALQAATLNAADLLRVADDRGKLAPGYLADIIAVEGNPLENIQTMEDVRFVMKGGKVYKRP